MIQLGFLASTHKMDSMPVGICKLCLQERQLQQSHLIPRGLYRPLRDEGEQNPNPAILNRTQTVRTSRQIADYLLCRGCEQLLNTNGENWVIPRAYNGTTFLLRDLLLAANPVWPGDAQFGVYAGGEIPDIDMDKLVYFAMSVFWRTSVHDWRIVDDTIRAPLFEYEEPVREFLLGGPFPDKAALHISMSSEVGRQRAAHNRAWPWCQPSTMSTYL